MTAPSADSPEQPSTSPHDSVVEATPPTAAEPRDCLALAPRIPLWATGLILVLSIGLGFAPRAFELPRGWTWLAYPSSVPILILFGWGLLLSCFRFCQLFGWSLSYQRWSEPLTEHAVQRLGIRDDGLVPESMQQLTLSETYRTMRSSVLFSHWLLFATCFALLIAALPLMLVHLQSLGRQTDLLAAMWVPGSLLVGASIIWMITVLAGGFASRALNRWRTDVATQYSRRYTAALAEMQALAADGEGVDDESAYEARVVDDDGDFFPLPDAEPDAYQEPPDDFFSGSSTPGSPPVPPGFDQSTANDQRAANAPGSNDYYDSASANGSSRGPSHSGAGHADAPDHSTYGGDWEDDYNPTA